MFHHILPVVTLILLSANHNAFAVADFMPSVENKTLVSHFPGAPSIKLTPMNSSFTLYQMTDLETHETSNFNCRKGGDYCKVSPKSFVSGIFGDKSWFSLSSPFHVFVAPGGLNMGGRIVYFPEDRQPNEERFRINDVRSENGCSIEVIKYPNSNIYYFMSYRNCEKDFQPIALSCGNDINACSYETRRGETKSADVTITDLMNYSVQLCLKKGDCSRWEMKRDSVIEGLRIQ